MARMTNMGPGLKVGSFGTLTDVGGGRTRVGGESVETITLTFDIQKKGGVAPETVGFPAAQGADLLHALCICMALDGDPLARAIVDRFFTEGAN